MPVPAGRLGFGQNGTGERRCRKSARADGGVERRREALVAAVQAGASQRAVAARFGVGLGTVQRALARADAAAGREIDWSDRSTAPHRTRRTDRETEDLVLAARHELAASLLGECGAVAIHRELTERGPGGVPSVRTIGRILERSGILDGRRRVRRPAPPPGWYLPDVAAREAELDAFDVIVGLRLRGGIALDVLTGVSLHGGLVAAWPRPAATAPVIGEALLGHWRGLGLPHYAQFDNDTRFLGSHGSPDILGAVPLLCLALGVTPVFAPLRETGFQNQVEGFNGRWQSRVWQRHYAIDIADLVAHSDRYVTAHRARRAARIERAPDRATFPARLPPSEPGPPRGRIVFLRRTGPAGVIDILGRGYRVDPAWPHRLVRAELDIDAQVIRCYALHRREPADQPLLAEIPYRLPSRRIWVTRTY